MQIYPGYTVRKIEEELSYREIQEMSKYWSKIPPTYANNKIIKELLAGALNVDLNQNQEVTLDKTIEAFKLLGF